MPENNIPESTNEIPATNVAEVPAINSAENTTEKSSRWRTLAEKVYELELLISSAGVYLSSNLPAFLDEIWEYYNYHFGSDVADIGFFSRIIYVVLSSSAVTLWLGFICHFGLRAFWIAMIGLANIFPQGVNYEHLPKKITTSYKDFLATKIRSYEQLISLIDKASSSVLVGVFSLIAIFSSVSLVYGSIVVALFLIKFVVPDAIFSQYSYLFILLSIVICFIIPIKKVIMILIEKRKDERKNELKYISQTATLFGEVIYHITLVLKTNLSKTSFNAVIIGVIVLTSVFGGFMVNKQERSKITTTNNIDLDTYENTRNNKKFINKICLNSDVVKEKYIKIFIANPKELKQYTRHFENFSVENLEREERKKQKKIFELAQWRKFFRIYVNDVPQEYELNFQTHLQTNAEGFVVYLPLSEPKTGKNILSIKILSSGKNNDKKTEIHWADAPFWYFP